MKLQKVATGAVTTYLLLLVLLQHSSRSQQRWTADSRVRPWIFFRRAFCPQERDDDDQDHLPLLANHSIENCGELQPPQTSPANIDAVVCVRSFDPAWSFPFGDLFT